jgi:hypothetical protein
MRQERARTARGKRCGTDDELAHQGDGGALAELGSGCRPRTPTARAQANGVRAGIDARPHTFTVTRGGDARGAPFGSVDFAKGGGKFFSAVAVDVPRVQVRGHPACSLGLGA